MSVRWAQSDIDRVRNKAPRAKYGAKRIQIDGVWFDSKREGARYEDLKMMQAAGLISDLRCHPYFDIGIRATFICRVELDFQYLDLKRGMVYEDVKSAPTNTALSKLKRKMVEAEYGIVVELVK